MFARIANVRRRIGEKVICYFVRKVTNTLMYFNYVHYLQEIIGYEFDITTRIVRQLQFS